MLNSFVRRLAASLVLLWSPFCFAYTNCTLPPPAVIYSGSTNIVHTGSTAAGTVIAQGTLTYTITCSGTTSISNQTGGSIHVGIAIPHASTGFTRATAVAGVGMQTYGSPTARSTTNPAQCSWSTTLVHYGSSGSVNDFTLSVDSPACTLTLTMPIQFIVTGSTGIGTPAVAISLGDTVGWVGDYQFMAPAPGVIGYFSIGSSISAGGVRNCVLSTPSTTVTLPTVAATAFPTANTTAGITAFQLRWNNCSASAGGFVGTLTWSFNPAASVVPGLIANSAGSPAASNVFVQLLSGAAGAPTPVTNAGITSFAVPAAASAGGTITQTYYARYYATAAPVTPGNVTGVATFTMTYN